MPLSPGTSAPLFELPLKPGEAPLRLADYRGEKRVVLLFFPLAFSGTCTEEICAVAEDEERWDAHNAVVIAVSVDSPWVNQKFADECGASFPILSDFNRRVVSEYEVRDDDFYGLKGVAYRSAFVIDREGEIVYSWMSEDARVLPDFEAIEEAVKGAK